MEKSKKQVKVVMLLLAAAIAMMMAVCMMPKQAHAANPTDTIAVNVQQNGVTTSYGSYSYSDLEGADLINHGTIGALFEKSGVFNVVGGKNYISINDLLDAAGVPSTAWTTGATLHFATTDFPGGYTKYYPTYAETANAQSFYPNTTQTTGSTLGAVTTYGAIAFDTASSPITSGQTAGQTLSGMSTWTSSPRFMVGLNNSTLNDSTANMGKRMPSAITSVTVVL